MTDAVPTRTTQTRSRRASLAASLLAMALAVAAVVIGAVGHRIGTDALSDGCTMEENHGTGPTMINVAWWILSPLTFLVGLTALVLRGPIWARLAGAISMIVAIVLAGWLMTTYWDYTCSY